MALATYSEGLLRASSFDQVKAWLAGGVGTDSLPTKPRVDDMDRVYIDNEDTTSGNALQVTSTITTSNVVDISAAVLTTGKAIDISNLGAITTGKVLHIDATGVTQTDGILVHVASASTVLTATGRLLLVGHTGVTTTSGVIAEVLSAATDETVIAQFLASGALLLGKILNVSGVLMTTGTGIAMSNLNALTSGIGLHIASSATAITGAGRLLFSNHTGATGDTAILNEFKSAANDETEIVQITATAALALGKALDISAVSMTTGTALAIADLNALTTGIGLHLASSATAITGAGRLLYVNHTGVTTTTGTVAEVASSATDETDVMKITGTGQGSGRSLVITGGFDLDPKGGYNRQEGISSRFRLAWVAGQRGKPGINADIQDNSTGGAGTGEAVRMIADPDFEIQGTSSTSALCTFNVEGGLILTTAAADSDQMILAPHLDASQSGWSQVTWGTDQSTRWECRIRTGASIVDTIIWAGLKLTNTQVTTTDANQAFFRYEEGIATGNWQAIDSIANTDNAVDSAVVVAINTDYHLVIDIDSSRVARFYIDGVLVSTSAALTNAIDLIPYIGVMVQAGGASGAKVLRVRGQAISRVFA